MSRETEDHVVRPKNNDVYASAIPQASSQPSNQPDSRTTPRAQGEQRKKKKFRALRLYRELALSIEVIGALSRR